MSDTKLIQNRTAAFGRRSSFWYQNVRDEDKPLVRGMSRMAGGLWQAPAQLSQMMDWARGETRVDVYDRAWKLSDKDIVVLGPDLSQRARIEFGETANYLSVALNRPFQYETGYELYGALNADGYSGRTVLSENQQVLLFPGSVGELTFDFSDEVNFTRFLILLPGADLRPSTLITKSKTLVGGIDFRVGRGFLVMDQDPRGVFDDNWMVMTSGTELKKPYMSYLLQSDYMYTSGSHIVNYHRYSQSLKSLELAAAEYAGLVVAPFTSTISQILYFEDSTILVTLDGVIRLPGFQEDFAIGDIVVKDTIMGGGFSLLGREDANDSSTWYKAMDWSDGLSLAGVTPFPGLVIPNDISLAEAYEYNAEHDNFHVRFTMSGDADQVEAFFARIKRVEAETGKFLNDLFGFTTLNETTTFFPIDFYFELLLSNKAIVALVDTTIHSPAVRERLVEFLAKNKPVGSVVITRNDVRANVFLPPNGGIVWFAIGDDEAFSPWEEAVFVVS